LKWDVVAPESILLAKIELPAGIILTTNHAYLAAAILFFMDQVLPDKWPEKNDVLHAPPSSTP
jgi:hypothetical protein